MTRPVRNHVLAPARFHCGPFASFPIEVYINAVVRHPVYLAVGFRVVEPLQHKFCVPLLTAPATGLTLGCMNTSTRP